MTIRARLREIAADNHGVFTISQAHEINISTEEVAKLAYRGAIQRVGSGVYRHTETLTDEFTGLAIALGAVGEDAFLVDDSVLALFDLALVSPAKIHVQTFGRRPRKKLPDTLVLERKTRQDIEVRYYFGLRCMSVNDALQRAKLRLRREQVERGAEQAFRKDLISDEDLRSLLNFSAGPINKDPQ